MQGGSSDDAEQNSRLRVQPKSRGNSKLLGRVLSSLLGNMESDFINRKLSDSYTSPEGASELPVSSLYPSENQPRKIFDQSSIQELANSIQESGILQPIVAVRCTDDPDSYRIVAGERRWRAAKSLGMRLVPCIVREFSEIETLVASLSENIQRQDLNPIEECEAFSLLINSFGKTQDEVASMVGKSRSYVANTLRMAGLPPEVKLMVIGGKLSAGHAKVLLSLPDAASIIGAANEILANSLSVRESEAMVRAMTTTDHPRAEQPPAVVEANHSAENKPAEASHKYDMGLLNKVEERFSQRFASTMQITPSKKSAEKGVIRIKYSSADELNDVLRSLVELD